MRHLADGGGLAGAVHPDHQERHAGLAPGAKRKIAAPAARARSAISDGEQCRAPRRHRSLCRSGRLRSLERMRAAMATPRSALINTSSSRSSVSSSSFRLVSALGEIVRQRARGAGEARAELVEPAPSWLRHRPRLWVSLSCARRAAIPQAAWRRAPLRGRRAAAQAWATARICRHRPAQDADVGLRVAGPLA